MTFENLIKPGTDFLGSRYPIIGGAMSWISDVTLTAAISNNGGFGVFASGHIPPAALIQELTELKKRTHNLYGVNLITISPIFEEQLEAALTVKPPVVVFAARTPTEKHIARAKAAGAKVMTFAPNLTAATRMIEAGADALIIEGHEAGGHVGSVSTIVLLQEILFNISEVPVFVAGGIVSGKLAAHIFMMGAAGVQLGTRFMLTHEAPIKPSTKDAFLKSQAKDALVSFGIDRRLGVVPVRTLRNKGVDDFIQLQIKLVARLEKKEITSTQATDEIEKFWLGALRRAVQDGDLEYGSLMAGNCVGLIKELLSVQEVIQNLVGEIKEQLAVITEKAKKA